MTLEVGTWEFLFPFSDSDAIHSKILYDFSRLAQTGSFFSISSFRSSLSYVWAWSPGELGPLWKFQGLLRIWKEATWLGMWISVDWVGAGALPARTSSVSGATAHRPTDPPSWWVLPASGSWCKYPLYESTPKLFIYLFFSYSNRYISSSSLVNSWIQVT